MKEKRKSNIERRNFMATELRTITDGDDTRRIVGYAAVFNTLSDDLGWFREKIDPGAFKETIGQDDVRALWNHDSNYVLGRNKAGTLALSEDDHGLQIDVTPPDAQWARDLMTSIDRGDVDQMSFGFETISDRWETVDKVEIRTLVKVRLYDVSPVTFPAYPDTEVGLRSLEEYRKTVKQTDGEEDANDRPVPIGLRRKQLELKTKFMEGF
jgi:uncharacterized protein